MILCDAVQVDRATGKTSLLGSFQNIQAPEYPARHPELAIFAELTDGRGEAPITLKVCRTTPDSDEGEELYSYTMDMSFRDPRDVQKLILKIAPFDIPQAGEYRFILECDGVFIIERRLVMLQSS